MNQSPSSSLVLSKALIGYLYFKTAEGLRDRSLESYERILKNWIQYFGDVEIDNITDKDIIGYLKWLRTEYVPQRFGGDTRALSPKTPRNIWIALSSFFAWASKEFKIRNPIKDVPPPRFQRAPVDAFSQKELELMLKACIHTLEADTYYR
ncbi:MAG: phage integrase N-terminal SAM-like domain-containing protein [Anaerolineae bacterium]|nr:phage integrase N-terminal SAM-like domain-containing protein [Anaerolineae bacterium]